MEGFEAEANHQPLHESEHNVIELAWERDKKHQRDLIGIESHAPTRSHPMLSSVHALTSTASPTTFLPAGLSVSKSAANPVIGPSGIPGSQDFCGARDMGIARAGVHSTYETVACF